MLSRRWWVQMLQERANVNSRREWARHIYQR
jgi:hypothetical protein